MKYIFYRLIFCILWILSIITWILTFPITFFTCILFYFARYIITNKKLSTDDLILLIWGILMANILKENFSTSTCDSKDFKKYMDSLEERRKVYKEYSHKKYLENLKMCEKDLRNYL